MATAQLNIVTQQLTLTETGGGVLSESQHHALAGCVLSGLRAGLLEEVRELCGNIVECVDYREIFNLTIKRPYVESCRDRKLTDSHKRQ
eukprot:gene46862-58442_t